MQRVISLVCAVLVAVVGLTPPAWASENEMMDALIHKLVKKCVLTREDAREIREEVAEEAVVMAKARAAETKDTVKKMKGGSWLDKVKWGGDFRLRHETQKREPAQDRTRERMRLRFGFTATPTDELEIGVRLATGASGDPVSTNQSFSATFDKKAVFIDKPSATYGPLTWLSLTGGKMENPFQTSDIVWDGDVTPEGAVVQWQMPGERTVRPFATVGAFQISELSADTGDPGLFAGQVGADVALPFGEGWAWQPSVAYYDVLSVLNNVKLGQWFGAPVAAFGDWTTNGGAGDHNGAWQVGLGVGKVTDKFGSWKAGYAYKRLESDATFGALTDSDFGTGGTNHKGHIMCVTMGLNKYANVGLKYLRTDEIAGSQAHNDTFQADLQMKF